MFKFVPLVFQHLYIFKSVYCNTSSDYLSQKQYSYQNSKILIIFLESIVVRSVALVRPFLRTFPLIVPVFHF